MYVPRQSDTCQKFQNVDYLYNSIISTIKFVYSFHENGFTFWGKRLLINTDTQSIFPD